MDVVLDRPTRIGELLPVLSSSMHRTAGRED
jgi:hypothetical protein